MSSLLDMKELYFKRLSSKRKETNHRETENDQGVALQLSAWAAVGRLSPLRLSAWLPWQSASFRIAD